MKGGNSWETAESECVESIYIKIHNFSKATAGRHLKNSQKRAHSDLLRTLSQSENYVTRRPTSTIISIHQTLQQYHVTSVIELQLQSTDVKQMSLDCNV